MLRAFARLLPSLLIIAVCVGCTSTVRFSSKLHHVSSVKHRKKSKTAATEKRDGRQPPPVDTVQPDSGLIGRCRAFLGTPYRWGGMSNAGVDCSGLVCLVYKQAEGMVLPRDTKNQHKLGRKISLANAQPGDLLFFSTGFWPGISHVGIYTGNGRFIHASTKRGVIESSIDDDYYRARFVEARRLFK